MHPWIYIDIAAFLVVVGLTGVIIPQILLIAFRKKLFDKVDPRKIHKSTVPRLGGIAFFPSILFASLLVWGVGIRFAPEILLGGLRSDPEGFCFVGCAVVILYLVGMADDLIGVKYRAKFAAQFLSAGLLILGGIRLESLHGFLWIGTLPVVFSVLLTAVLTVYITNAINLIDGIDGLASGLSAVACAFYGVIFFRSGLHLYGVLSFATLGALVPFFYYNVFGDAKKHSKIFMGDTGALTVGLILSVLSLRTSQMEDVAGGANMAAVAFAPLMIPCLDVIRVYFHRLREHRNPFLPDKCHIHHKLLALGLNQRTAMLSIVATALALTVANYWLSRCVDLTLLFILDLAFWIFSNMILTRAIRKRNHTD